MTAEIAIPDCSMSPFSFLGEEDDEAMMQQTIERLSPRLSAPPPSLNDGPDSNSILSSLTGEPVYTPSPSPQGDDLLHLWNTESIVFGAGSIDNTLAGAYSPSMTISSPSNSSHSPDNVSFEEPGDVPSAPPCFEMSMPGQSVPSTFLPGMELAERTSLSGTNSGTMAHETSLSLEDMLESNIHVASSQPSTATYAASTSYSAPQNFSIAQHGERMMYTMPYQYNMPIQDPAELSQTIQGNWLNQDHLNFGRAPASQIQDMEYRVDENSMHSFNDLSDLTPHTHGYFGTTFGYQSYPVSVPVQNSRQASVSSPKDSTPRRLLTQREPPSSILHSTPAQNGQSRTTPQRPSTLRIMPSVPPKERVQMQSPGSSEGSSPHSATSAPSPCCVKKNEGGRKRPLTEQEKQEAAVLRVVGSCWPCVINRGKCSKGEICERCRSMTKSKGNVIGCVRTHIDRDMWDTFVPSSMDPSQLYKTDDRAISEQDIGQWHPTAKVAISVPFSIGIAKPFYWDCHEFLPKSGKLQNQTWNVHTSNGQHYWEANVTDSPALGIKNYRAEELRGHLTKWVDRMLEENLEDVQDMYYWEGHRARGEILTLLCTLYDSLRKDTSIVARSPSDYLRENLHKALSLILITYITTHAFTVAEDQCARVLNQLSNPGMINPDFYRAEYLILETANSQLKHALSGMRSRMHRDLLSRLQTITKHASYKKWWLSSFVIMLGLAFTVEESQHLLHVQADSRARKAQHDLKAVEAHWRKAEGQCRDIDAGYDFLQGLYHYRYSLRKEGRASFRQWMNMNKCELAPAEKRFADGIVKVCEEHDVVLDMRKRLRVQVNDDGHVLRLVGKFLTSVMWTSSKK